jgi:hypothetical protein
VRVDPAAIRELRVRSGSDGTLLIFATAPAVSRDDLHEFRPSSEVSELVITHGPRDDIVFPLDAEVLAERFAGGRVIELGSTVARAERWVSAAVPSSGPPS